MAASRRDFSLANSQPLLQQPSFGSCVGVQSAHSLAENGLQLRHVAAHAFSKDVVGWGDLPAENVS